MVEGSEENVSRLASSVPRAVRFQFDEITSLWCMCIGDSGGLETVGGLFHRSQPVSTVVGCGCLDRADGVHRLLSRQVCRFSRPVTWCIVAQCRSGSKGRPARGCLPTGRVCPFLAGVFTPLPPWTCVVQLCEKRVERRLLLSHPPAGCDAPWFCIRKTALKQRFSTRETWNLREGEELREA